MHCYRLQIKWDYKKKKRRIDEDVAFYAVGFDLKDAMTKYKN
jgi:hypothetical protein